MGRVLRWRFPNTKQKMIIIQTLLLIWISFECHSENRFYYLSVLSCGSRSLEIMRLPCQGIVSHISHLVFVFLCIVEEMLYVAGKNGSSYVFTGSYF